MKHVFYSIALGSVCCVLSGCGTFSYGFSCKKTAHDTCLSLPQAYHLSQATLHRSSAHNHRRVIWVAPYIDEEGNHHSAYQLSYPVTDQ